jgi:hypothetical protein
MKQTQPFFHKNSIVDLKIVSKVATVLYSRFPSKASVTHSEFQSSTVRLLEYPMLAISMVPVVFTVSIQGVGVPMNQTNTS